MVLILNAFLTIYEGLSWQWLRLHASTVGSTGSIAGQGTNKNLYELPPKNEEKRHEIN